MLIEGRRPPLLTRAGDPFRHAPDASMRRARARIAASNARWRVLGRCGTLGAASTFTVRSELAARTDSANRPAENRAAAMAAAPTEPEAT